MDLLSIEVHWCINEQHSDFRTARVHWNEGRSAWSFLLIIWLQALVGYIQCDFDHLDIILSSVKISLSLKYYSLKCVNLYSQAPSIPKWMRKVKSSVLHFGKTVIFPGLRSRIILTQFPPAFPWTEHRTMKISIVPGVHCKPLLWTTPCSLLTYM